MKNASINILKIIASIMVITIHVSAINFPKLGAEQWAASNIYNSFSRVCVPLFFMISGYFLVTRDDDMLTFYKKRMSKIIAPLLFWSFFFYLVNHYYFGAELYNPLDMLIKPASAHLWYLYAIIGLYAICPFISKIYNNSTPKEKLLFLVFWFVCSSVFPTLNACYGIFINIGLFQLTSIYGYIGFFFIGAWIKDNPATSCLRNKVIYFGIYVAGSILTMMLTEKLSVNAGKPSMVFYSYLSPIVIASSLSLFYLVVNFKVQSKALENIGNLFSSFSLGVYCVHTVFIGTLAKEFHIGGDVTPSTIYIVVTVLLTFILSCLVSFLCSKIPVLKRVF